MVRQGREVVPDRLWRPSQEPVPVCIPPGTPTIMGIRRVAGRRDVGLREVVDVERVALLRFGFSSWSDSCI